jgi:protein SCO1/2
MKAMVALALAFAAVVAVGTPGCGQDARQLAGIVRDPAPTVDVARVPDAARGGAPTALRAASGGLLLVYFGYTLCPDVCPTTMSDIRLALAELDPDARRRVRVGVVTIDPERDTGRVLRRYVRSFVANGSALRTDDPKLLARVARAFGAGYGIEKRPDGTVEVSHTAFTYVVDDRGRLVLQWPFGTPWEDMHDDLEALLEQRKQST